VAEPKTIEIPSIPASADEYLSLRDTLSAAPCGGAAALVVALLVYAQDAKVGEACVAIAVDRGRLVSGPRGYKGWQLPNTALQRLSTQIRGHEYLPASYLAGTTPENGYALGEPPHIVTCTTGPYSGDPSTGTFKVFVISSGAASPRPVTLKINDRGLWKASEWSSLIVGVQPPASSASDDL
jgi:hypothetical protein